MAFQINGQDLTTGLVPKQYLLDIYPSLSDQVKSPALWGWGADDYGQLGDNTIVHKSSPVQTIAGGTNWKSVACGQAHNAAIKNDGTLWTWGRNSEGQLGDNTNVKKSSPVQTIAGGTNWKQVAGGYYHTAAIKTDGTLWTWGYNTAGQLGDNTQINKSSPVQTVAGGTNWKSVACGVTHTAAIKTDGTLWLWGYNAQGELGDNTNNNKKSSPVQTIAGGTNWKSVACGQAHNAAIKNDGTLWLWGSNSYGNLGDNTIAHKSSPIQTIAGGTNWKSVACYGFNTAAIKTDGTLWTWGNNNVGQLGDGTIIPKSSPIQTVAGGTNWKSVACGNQYIVAIKTDGTLWGWGNNSTGQLGVNTQVHTSSPIQTIAGGTNWKSIACAGNQTAAIADGDVLL